MVIRPKTASDTRDLVALTQQVHRSDGYPRYPPADLADFMSPGCEDEGWIAELHGRIVGHAALHRAAGDPTLPAAQRATMLSHDRLAVLARLVVGAAARRQGVARELIAAATQHADARGQRVVLDVMQDAGAAIALYEALGWVRVEPLQLFVGNDHTLDLWVYLSPTIPT